jgi:hypothetical protein
MHACLIYAYMHSDIHMGMLFRVQRAEKHSFMYAHAHTNLGMVMQLLSKMWKAKKNVGEDQNDDKGVMGDFANSLLFDLTFDDDKEALKASQKPHGKAGVSVKSTPGASLKQRKAKR